MKPRNFPARKVMRQINAGRDMSKPYSSDELKRLDIARDSHPSQRRYRAT